MQYKQSQILPAVQRLTLVVVATAVVIVSGCGQKEQVEKKPASPPNVTVEFNGPGNRVDASFQPFSPE